MTALRSKGIHLHIIIRQSGNFNAIIFRSQLTAASDGRVHDALFLVDSKSATRGDVSAPNIPTMARITNQEEKNKSPNTK
jgi:hypothetical protein